jgi:hypothetical protein
MNRRHGLLVVLLVMVAIWCSLSVAFSQGKPDFGTLDQGGMPRCLLELSPQAKSSGWIVNAGTPYAVWAAPKIVGQQIGRASWRERV